MSAAAKLNLQICQGKTFAKVLRWGQPRKRYGQITEATKTAPCVLEVIGHGLPDGWMFTIANVGGMKELNSPNRETNGGYYAATVVDVDHIELNDVDATGFHAYTSGGVIAFNAPVDLTGYTARMQVRASLESATTLLELTTEDGGIVIDSATQTITINLDPTATAALTWATGVYELEMVAAGGQVSTLIYGAVRVVKEVTR